MNRSHITRHVLLPAIICLAACGQEQAEETVQAPPTGPMAGRACGGPAMPARTPSAPAARVFFITPGDGDTVSSPVHLEFGLSGMEVAPAGDDRPGTGHHHIIIDSDLPPLGLPVPADEHHVHFGDGRTKTELTLAPGEHTLQLLFADHLHIPHDPPLFSERIRITIE
jgi:hypothetical protein